MLTGKVALVTGGGRGIGEAIAEAFSRAGASLVLAARTRQEVETVAARLRQASSPAVAVACDVADPQQVERLMVDTVTALTSAGPRIDSSRRGGGVDMGWFIISPRGRLQTSQRQSRHPSVS